MDIEIDSKELFLMLGYSGGDRQIPAFPTHFVLGLSS